MLEISKTIEVAMKMSPIPTSGEQIAPIKKGKKPTSAETVPVFFRSALIACLETVGKIKSKESDIAKKPASTK